MSDTLTRNDVVEDLTEIQQQMLNLIENARGVMKAGGFTGALDRAEDYWIAHLITAISDDHGYLGGSMCTLQDIIEEIESGEDEEEDDGWHPAPGGAARRPTATRRIVGRARIEMSVAPDENRRSGATHLPCYYSTPCAGQLNVRRSFWACDPFVSPYLGRLWNPWEPTIRHCCRAVWPEPPNHRWKLRWMRTFNREYLK